MSKREPYNPKAPRWVKGYVKIHFSGEGFVCRIEASGTAGMALARSLRRGMVPAEVVGAFARSFGFDAPASPPSDPADQSKETDR